MKMTAIQPESWKEDYRQFEQATEQFYSGEMDAKTYKGISGGFGSYAQKAYLFCNIHFAIRTSFAFVS